MVAPRIDRSSSPALASEWRHLRRRLGLPFMMLVLTHLVGTVGFMLAWSGRSDATWLDALFMTFITVSTVGFGEVHPLGTFGRFVAMAVAAGGIGSLFYSFSLVLDFLGNPEVQGARRRRRMTRRIEAMEQHVVIAGFGRVGREAAGGLSTSEAQVVVIDPDARHEADALERGFAFVC
ncbi:MAG: potassium channel protein [Archangiaceae bacterium]|nr:potassium channel protein [Archangiaceae bacterium]